MHSLYRISFSFSYEEETCFGLWGNNITVLYTLYRYRCFQLEFLRIYKNILKMNGFCSFKSCFSCCHLLCREVWAFEVFLRYDQIWQQIVHPSPLIKIHYWERKWTFFALPKNKISSRHNKRPKYIIKQQQYVRLMDMNVELLCWMCVIQVLIYILVFWVHECIGLDLKLFLK